jgi:uncharacterized protein YgiM (DUF1202 family)
VGRRSNRQRGWIVLAAVALAAALADAATLNKRARLREGPSKDTRLLGWLEANTAVEIDAERSGWYLVRSPDGQSGYIWKEHLSFDPSSSPPESPPPTFGATTTTAREAPRDAPTSPSTMPAPAVDPRASAAPTTDATVVAELERLRGEVGQLATAQKEILQRLGQTPRPGPAPASFGSDGSAGAAILFTAIGAVIGWLFGRFGPGRRERRSRLRL